MWLIVTNLLKSKASPIIIAIIVSLIIGFFSGYKVVSWREDAKRIEAVQRAIEEYNQRDIIREEIDTATIDSLRKSIKNYINSTKKVKQYVKENPTIASRECLDATGLQLFNIGSVPRD